MIPINELLVALREARERVRNVYAHFRGAIEDGEVLKFEDCSEARKIADDIEKYCQKIWSLSMDLDEPREGDRLADDNEASKEVLIEE